VAEKAVLAAQNSEAQVRLARVSEQAEEERASVASEMTYLTGQLNEELQAREKLGVQVHLAYVWTSFWISGCLVLCLVFMFGFHVWVNRWLLVPCV
jgi:hypothetical protein